MRRTNLSTFSIFALVLAIAAAVQISSTASALAGSAVSISDILSSPSTYSGVHVPVSGPVANVAQKKSHAGNDYETFDLCDLDGNCVRVSTWGHPVLNEGDKVTVRRTFSATKHVSGYTFHNEIEADEGAL